MGVDVTYKNKKGFQLLQINWRNFIVDAYFRYEKAHSNHGNNAQKVVKRIVGLISKHYSKNVPIILTCNSRFLDEKNLYNVKKTLGILNDPLRKLFNIFLVKKFNNNFLK